MMVFAGREGLWKYDGVAEDVEGLNPRPRMEGVDDPVGARELGVLL